MVTPDTQNIETAPANADAEAASLGSGAKKPVDEDVAALARVSIPFVFVACIGLLVAVVGLYIDRFNVALSGVSLVALGALAWVVAASTVIWKMGKELVIGRRGR